MGHLEAGAAVAGLSSVLVVPLSASLVAANAQVCRSRSSGVKIMKSSLKKRSAKIFCKKVKHTLAVDRIVEIVPPTRGVGGTNAVCFR